MLNIQTEEKGDLERFRNETGGETRNLWNVSHCFSPSGFRVKRKPLNSKGCFSLSSYFPIHLAILAEFRVCFPSIVHRIESSISVFIRVDSLSFSLRGRLAFINLVALS